jgi:hypothetical protein
MSPPDPASHPTDDDRVFFLHVPKVAGWSFNQFIEPHFDPRRTLVPRFVDPTNADPRSLGLACNWIELTPA